VYTLFFFFLNAMQTKNVKINAKFKADIFPNKATTKMTHGSNKITKIIFQNETDIELSKENLCNFYLNTINYAYI